MLEGYKEFDAEIKPRLIVRISGLDMRGKTTFALTAPGPIAISDMDRGLEGVANQFVSDKELLVASYRDMPATTADQQKKKWETFKDNYYTSLKSPAVKSIVWDTESESWEMIRLARFGKFTAVKPHHYAPVNREYRTMIDAAFDSNKNLIMIDKVKKQYVAKKSGGDAQWSGMYEPSGFSELRYLVQVDLEAFRSDEGEFGVRVVKCRQNATLIGMELEAEICTFPLLASLVLEGTEPEDWE